MKTINYVLSIVSLILLTSLAFGQEKATLNNIDLLKGEVQANGLPKNWMRSADNFDCTIRFENGAIYFERMSPDEPCSFAFRQSLPNGDYLLKTKFEIDGNEPEIFLNGKPMKKQHQIKVTDGVMNVGIRTKGAGKVSGIISSMSLSTVSKLSLHVSPTEQSSQVTFSSLSLSTVSFAQQTSETSKPDAAAVDAVWDALSVFEGSYKTITNDFDCQGMSVGVAQWNVGKSFSSVRNIVLANSSIKINGIMPRYGNAFISALNNGKEATLSFVRSLQDIQRQDSCDAKVRKAKWNARGKEFVAELASLLITDESVKTQKELRYNIFVDGWRNANKWAVAVRGEKASPSMKEIAYFVDMQIFNGGGFTKFGIEYEKIPAERITSLSKETISYLEKADDDFLLHKVAARKNAKLLNPGILNESEAALFVNAFAVSQKLNAPYAKQFRLTVINRRAAILFGRAYYSDRDDAPTPISLPQQ